MRDAQGLPSTDEVLLRVWTHAVENKFVGNTTLAVILTNAHFDKAALCKIAGMAHDGYARSIRPVHSSADGDSIYAVSLGDVTADKDLVGELAAQTVSEAILRPYGVPGECTASWQRTARPDRPRTETCPSGISRFPICPMGTTTEEAIP